MHSVNMFQAKSSLSKLVESLENGSEQEVVIARHGRPAAVLSRFTGHSAEKRIGVAKGLFEVPDNIDADNETVALLFTGNDR